MTLQGYDHALWRSQGKWRESLETIPNKKYTMLTTDAHGLRNFVTR